MKMKLIRKIFVYAKARKQDSLILVGSCIALFAIILWGAFCIINEVELENSYYISEGKVIRVWSYAYIINSATIEYVNDKSVRTASIDYFVLNANVKTGDVVKIRISLSNSNIISFDQKIGYRIVPQYIKILLGMLLALLVIPFWKRKIRNYFLDN